MFATKAEAQHHINILEQQNIEYSSHEHEGKYIIIWVFNSAKQRKEIKPKTNILIDNILYEKSYFDTDLYNFFSHIHPEQYARLIEKLLTSQTNEQIH